MRRTWAMLLPTALIAATLIATGEGTATAATKATYYLSLGDSLAVGCQPIGPPFCGGNLGYPDQLYRAIHASMPDLRLVRRACDGESTGSMITAVGSTCTYLTGSQLNAAVAFIQAHPGEMAFVTIDVGANDVLRPDMGACFDPETGVLSESCVQAVLPSAQANLATILQTLRAALDQAGDPSAPIIGMNYYDPFLGFAAILGPPGETLAGLDNQAVLALNTGLEATYTDAVVPFTDVAAAFDIESYPSVQSVENTCNWTWFCAPPPLGPDIHPNADGYGVIAAAFEELLPH